MERRIAALVLIAAGVWVQWGPGFGLIAAGALLAVSGLDLEPARAVTSARKLFAKMSQLVAAMPRRATAAALIALAAVTLPIGAVLAAGAWAGYLAVAAAAGIVGTVLGWE